MTVAGFIGNNLTATVEVSAFNGDSGYYPLLTPFPNEGLIMAATFIQGKPLVCRYRKCLSYSKSNWTSWGSGNGYWEEEFLFRKHRIYPSMVHYSNSEVWIIGGYQVYNSEEKIRLNSTELCSLSNKGCKEFVDLPEHQAPLNAIVVNDTHIFISSLTRLWLFNKDTKNFSIVPNVQEYARNIGRFLFGLVKGKEIVASRLKRCYILNLVTLQWRIGPVRPTYLYYASSFQYENTFILIGDSTTKGSKVILKFDAENYKWIYLDHQLTENRNTQNSFLIPSNFFSAGNWCN